MGEMTLLGGSICTLDGRPWCNVKEIKDITDEIADVVAARLELPKEILFSCSSFDINHDPWLAKMFGVWRRKKAKPVRKRLLERLKNRYGWYRTQDFTLTPCGDGKFSCRADAGLLEVTIQNGDQGSLL